MTSRQSSLGFTNQNLYKKDTMRLRTFFSSIVLVSVILYPALSSAEIKNKRGFVTTAACPYSCSDAGVPKSHCKTWRRGSSCSVEDLRKGPGHQSVIKFFSAKRQLTNRKRSFRGIDGTWITLSKKENDSRKKGPIFKNGMITSAPCPFDCRIAGISKAYCREKKVGNTCQVEDLRQPPGHQSLVHVGPRR